MFVGWFGPRGLASVVFAIIILDAGVPGIDTIGVTIAVTIVLSVLLHGISANPVIGALSARWRVRHLDAKATRRARPQAAGRGPSLVRIEASSTSISASTAFRSSPPDMIAITSSRVISDLRKVPLPPAAVEQREDVADRIGVVDVVAR